MHDSLSGCSETRLFLRHGGPHSAMELLTRYNSETSQLAAGDRVSDAEASSVPMSAQGMPTARSSSISEDDSSAPPSTPRCSGKRKLSEKYLGFSSTKLDVIADSCNPETEIGDLHDFSPQPKKKTRKDEAVAVRIPSLAFPKSLYVCEEPDTLVNDERTVLKEVLVWINHE